MVAVLMVSMVGPGVAAAAPSATATATTDNVVTNTNHATTTNSETVTSQFQQEQADSCSPLETRLASIFSTYGYTVPDSLADCIDHDSSAVDSDEPSETGPDTPDSDDDTDETADESDTDETDETEEPSDTTDDSSDSDETETDETDDSADTDSNSDADETDEESTDDTTDSSTDEETDTDTTTDGQDGDQTDSSTDEETDTDTTTDSQDGDQTDFSADEETDGFDRAAVERGIHEAVNDERTARGLNELAFDTELRDIAREHSRDMAERDYFSHTSPEGDTFADRYADAGYTCRVDGSDNTYYTGGENIAQTWYDTAVRTDGGTDTYTTETELANAIVTQWMNSSGHRENILASQWENEGIGIYMTDDGKVYATQNFC
ncbi:CAP domain-containing protein [Natrinema limicola]|uniref:SCP domain-containing protein n=1 Tax=Natrinema limicola JCM 13563 TaxID=1230457 RepID=M0C8K2_9EURY|nr:CAP domain-containing protein [Natrinema limicola]ELZ18687.1 hypothetical protein C476_13892 [Natrinema limicola JCM 13563]